MKTRHQLLPPKLLHVTRYCLLALILPVLLQASGDAGTPATAAPATAPERARVTEALRSSPVMFIENVGQFDDRAHFQVRGGMDTMWLADDALWITVFKQGSKGAEGPGRDSHPHLRTSSPLPRPGVNLKLTFPSANLHPRIEPFDRLDTVVSYFIGNDPDQWHPDVPVWGGVRYKDLYPGIDLELTSENGRLMQHIIAHPGADLSEVRLRVDGADALALDGDGLRLTTAVGDFTLPLLQAVTTDGMPLDLTAARLEVNGTDVTSPFSLLPTLPVSVSPQDNPDDLLYSTFLGGSDDDWPYALAVDGTGAAYVAGYTRSADFPTTPGAFDTSFNGGYWDAFVAKLAPNGGSLTYATFLGGGSSLDDAYALVVDGTGAAYVAGRTYSADFPTTPGAFDTSHNGDVDAFVVKLAPDGGSLAYATFLGGNRSDVAYALAVDGAGTAYVAGSTYSPNADFPTTPGAFDTTFNGSNDAFVVKLAADGGSLAYATFLGGGDNDMATALAVDSSGAAYVTGSTDSADFPTTPGAFDTTFNNGTRDAFVVKLVADGGSLAYATFLGGTSGDEAYALAIDSSGAAYVVGWTHSADFPTTPGAFDTTFNGGDQDAFVVKVNVSGNALTYATFLGGNSGDYVHALAVDASGAAYVAGGTLSADFPTTPGDFDTSPSGGYSAFLARLAQDRGSLAYATFLGGTSGGEAYALALDSSGAAYVVGGTVSSDFPTTPGAFDTSYNGSGDAFVTKLAVGGGHWQIECVDCPKQFSGMGPRSLALDGTGHPHIAYGENHLYYAYHDGTAWHIETVDNSPGVGMSTSLALDRDKHPHISYYDQYQGHLKYTHHDGTSWHIETVDIEVDATRYTSLALDASGHPHISYFDDIDDDLKYAYHDGTRWHIETVDNKGWYSSLVLDRNDHPHISYFNDHLKYAHHDGTAWHIETVDSTGRVGLLTSLALDEDDHPHISYFDDTNDDLKYARYDGTAWFIETVDSVGLVGWSTSLMLDRDGHPHISYRNSSNDELRYAHHDGTSWFIEIVDNAAPMGAMVYTSLALNGDGYPHIGYSDDIKVSGVEDRLKYARHDGTSWHIEVVDTAGWVNGNSSLALDGDSRAHISYFVDMDDDLKYAYHDGTRWHIGTVDSEGIVGLGSSLALDEGGHPHISYFDNTFEPDSNLKYAYHDGTAWHTERVAWVAWKFPRSSPTSLALDGEGHPHISYQVGDWPDKYLKYAHHDGTAWRILTVDRDSITGYWNSLALDAAGHPHIAYDGPYSDLHADLRHAHYDGTAWHMEVVDSVVNGPYGISLALDVAGHPHISYSHTTPDGANFKYAYHDGTTWHIEIVDSTGAGAGYTSLALDGDNRPHISYYDYSNDDLRYAHHDGIAWHIETVDSEGDVGKYTSLALDRDGHPHISYFDQTNFGLKYAFQVAGPPPTPVPQDPLTLSASSTYATTERIVTRTSVYNSSSASKIFNVTVSLLKDGATEASLTQTPTVAGYGTASLTFDFGARAAGSYRIKAELFEGATLLKTKWANFTVLDSTGIRLAGEHAEELKGAVESEFDQMATIPARALADEAIRFGLDALQDYAVGKFADFAAPIQDAAGIPRSSSDSAVSQIRDKLGILRLKRQNIAAAVRLQVRNTYGIELPSDFDPLNDPLKNISDVTVREGVKNILLDTATDFLKSPIKWLWTEPQMANVELRHTEFMETMTSAFPWSSDIEQIFDRGKDRIKNIVESDAIVSVGPYNVLGHTVKYDVTLQEQENKRHDLRQAGRWLKIALALLTVVAVVIILLLFIGAIASTGFIATVIAPLVWYFVKLLLSVSKVIKLATAFLAVSMLFTVSAIAPHVTTEHDNTLDAVESTIGSQGQALGLIDFSVTSARKDQPVKLSARVESGEVRRTANPVVETTIYSIDGRVVRIIWANPTIQPHQTALLEKKITLRPGQYKAVTTIHTGDQIAIASQAQTFQVAEPKLQLSVSLNKTQFTLGEAVRASITITNTDVISDVNDLTLIAESSDGQNFDAWPVSLAAGESKEIEYSFIPPQEGSYVLRASLSIGLNVLASQDVGYLVGSGHALALNFSAQEVYDPGLDVTVPVTLTNVGDQASTITLTVNTLDRLHDLTQVFSQTHDLNVDAVSSTTLDATVLPGAQPGLYTTRLALGGEMYNSFDFAVAAQDTLFADIYPDQVIHQVGDTVQLNVQVMNSVYTYTAASTDVVLTEPTGVTQTIAMSGADGQYQGSYTASITGTYPVEVSVSKPDYRAVSNTSFFIAGQRSVLLPTVTGQPAVGQTAPLTVTVENELGTTIPEATVELSRTNESYSLFTDESGQAIFLLSPHDDESYHLTVSKMGFLGTEMEVPIAVISDTVPPFIIFDAPAEGQFVNTTPFTVTGMTEISSTLTLNAQPVALDAQGLFTTTVALSEGSNLLTAIATDPASNSTTVTRTVNLDTAPPALAVTSPTDCVFTTTDVITVTGSTEVGASLTVSGTLSTVQPDGSFTAWVLLSRGENVVPVVSTDAASNSTTITRTVGHSPLFGDVDFDCSVDVTDIMAVSSVWRVKAGQSGYEPFYDVDGDDDIDVVDVMLVAARWGERCE